MVVSVGFVLLYAVATVLGRASHLPGMTLAVAWPAAGAGFVWLAHVWRRPRERRLAVALLFTSSVLTQLATGQRPAVAALFALASTVQALVACSVHQRMQPRGFRLRQPRDLWALLIAAVLGAGAGALIGATTAVHLLDQPPGMTVLGWVVRHTAGTVVLAVLWLRARDSHAVAAPGARWVEYVLVMVASAMFFAWMERLQHVPLTFLMVPWAVWLGLRVRAATALVTVAVNDVLLILLTRAGSGPFAEVPGVERVIDVQLLILVLTVLTVMLVLHREEHHRLNLQLEQALEDARSSSRLLSTVFETTAEGLSVYDAAGDVVLRNRAAQEAFGDLPEDLDVNRWEQSFAIAHPDGAPWPVQDLPLARALRGEHVEGVDMLVTTADAPQGRLLNLTAHPMPLQCPAVAGEHRGRSAEDGRQQSDEASSRGAVLALRDVTAERAAQARLAASEQRFRTAFDTAPVGMMIVGLTEANAAQILQVNTTMSAFTGFSVEELLARDFHDLTHPDDRGDCVVSFAPFLLGELTQAQVEKRYRHVDGTTRWGMLSATVMTTAAATATARGIGAGCGEVVGPQLLCLIEDITARKAAEEARAAAEEALRHQALHDGLTGLPNRTLLHDRLTHALGAASRSGGQVGVLFCDLDGFKAVNDSAGHAAGDELLRTVAVRFSACLRPGDTLARLGGDEFAVICPEVPDAVAVRSVAERLLSALGEPVLLDAGTFGVGVSIGLSLAAAGTEAEVVLAQADAAMYEAKRRGRNRVHSHDGQERPGGARSTQLLS